MADLQDAIKNAKDALPDVTPTPPGLKAESAAYDLKARLEWGEPALTIVDVRDREIYNMGRITGAIPMPMEQLADLAQSSLAPERDIYVYGESDEQASQAVDILRGAGFKNVAQIMGGLPAWREVAGPTEGVEEDTSLAPSAFNVVSRLSTEREVQAAGKAQQSSR
jgi:rhodanese-related sulfurtransferase